MTAPLVTPVRHANGVDKQLASWVANCAVGIASCFRCQLFQTLFVSERNDLRGKSVGRFPTTPTTFSSTVADSLVAAGFAMRLQIIWTKDRFALSRGDYHWQHEPCWYAVRAGKKGHWAGDRKQSTRWDINAREDGGMGHGTQKPVECMRLPIENNSNVGQAVYEPFSGSGTTIVAAEMTGRACHAIEIDPAYVDVAILRWQAFTGLTATLEGDGRNYEQLSEQGRGLQ